FEPERADFLKPCQIGAYPKAPIGHRRNIELATMRDKAVLPRRQPRPVIEMRGQIVGCERESLDRRHRLMVRHTHRMTLCWLGPHAGASGVAPAMRWFNRKRDTSSPVSILACVPVLMRSRSAPANSSRANPDSSKAATSPNKQGAPALPVLIARPVRDRFRGPV